MTKVNQNKNSSDAVKHEMLDNPVYINKQAESGLDNTFRNTKNPEEIVEILRVYHKILTKKKKKNHQHCWIARKIVKLI